MYIKNIKKDYGASVKIMSYYRGFEVVQQKCQEHDLPACQICWPRRKDAEASFQSLMRSKVSITDYVLANQFDLFCTFTYNPEKVDSFDIPSAKEKMSVWLMNQKKTSPNLKYLIVAELHPTSGRIHFHALFLNYLDPLTPAMNKKTNEQRLKNGRPVFNMSKWRFGFSTAIKIDNIEKVASYVQKYITKDMLKITNKRRFWASRNLNKPVKTHNINMQKEVFDQPIFITNRYYTETFKIYRMVNVEQ